MSLIDYFGSVVAARKDINEIDAGHGRIEERTYRQRLINGLIPEADKWAGIKTAIEVMRRRELKDKLEEEIVYYISSLSINLPLIADTIRGH